ncbi:putative inositol monophosphatase 3 isoform X1 [Colias croceus]|uniref:putative inositol monophosphatase 3 isoform X1 n=1 Tax=Colias crocea TaxID=72248 RepID=UPI001E27A3FD|nr:putative inositol monophosphatase 3 isoform X1 [Colias croceus]
MNFGGTLRLNKFACFTLGFVLFLIIYWRSSGTSYPSDTSDLVSIKSLLNAAIYAAERGGIKVIEGKNRGLKIHSKGKTKEGANDPVTDADYASHCAMYYTLKNAFPKLSIISEEHSVAEEDCQNQEPIDLDSPPQGQRIINYISDELVLAKDVTVWIDPLDATQEYTEALYSYVTTMVCVAINGVPIVGVIHYPFPPTTYWGWLMKRTSSNIPKVLYKEDNKLHPRVIVSRSHPGKVADIANKAFGPKTSITPSAGAGNKYMSVVNGTHDIYLHETAIKKWDLCAGHAILKANNGTVTTTNGERIDYSSGSNVVVSDGILATLYDHQFYLKKLKQVL